MRATRTLAYLGGFGLAVGLALAPVTAAWSAEPSSAEQIIDALTPTDSGPMVTRGIRLGGQPPAVPKPGTPTSTGGMARPAKQAEASLTVPFATGSSSISPAASRVLDQLGQALASPKLAQFKFRVEGHTDTVGQPESNKALSERRAASVTEYLVTRFGIDRARLQPVGMGQEGLLVETGPGVPETRNRRVLVVNVGS